MLLVAVFSLSAFIYNVGDKIYKLYSTLSLRSKSRLGWTRRTRWGDDIPRDPSLPTSNTIHYVIVLVRILFLRYRRSALPKLKKAIAIKLFNEYGVLLAKTNRLLGLLILGVV
jgi:hypothetical protein